MTTETGTPANDYNISRLRVEIGGARVTLQAGSEFSLTLVGNPLFTNTVENGTWIIRGKPEIPLHWLRGEPATHYTISLPADTVLEELTLDIGAGMLEASPLHVNKATLKTSAGKMDLHGLSVDGPCDVIVGAGQTVLTDAAVNGPCDIEVGAGMLTLTGMLAQGADIECSVGQAGLTLKRPAAYGYKAKCGMGSIKVDGQSISGMDNHKAQDETAAVCYNIECGMGAVNVNFRD